MLQVKYTRQSLLGYQMSYWRPDLITPVAEGDLLIFSHKLFHQETASSF